jgi:hypothetical protein
MPEAHIQSPDEVERALLALAFGGLELQGAEIGREAEAYLADLVGQGAAQMVSEGAMDDRSFARAAASLTQVVSELGQRLPLMADGSLGEIEVAAVTDVVAFLCPGLWPFC